MDGWIGPNPPFCTQNQTQTQTPRLRSGGWKLTWEYACGVYGLVDLLSVLPFFINLFAISPRLSLRTYNQDVLAAMHFSRSLRLLKLLRCVRSSTFGCWRDPGGLMD